MVSGRLGISAPAANTNTTVYTAPAGMVATLNISLTNRGTEDAVVDIALAATATPASAEFIEFGVKIPAKGVLERTAIVAGAGERVVVRASTANVSVRVHGYEEGV